MGMNASTKRRRLARLMRRQKNCYYCGCVLTKDNRSIDHVIPLLLGGPDHHHNLVLCCISCNGRKGSSRVLPAPWTPRSAVSREWCRLFPGTLQFSDLSTYQYRDERGRPLRWAQVEPLLMSAPRPTLGLIEALRCWRSGEGQNQGGECPPVGGQHDRL